MKFQIIYLLIAYYICSVFKKINPLRLKQYQTSQILYIAVVK